MKDKNGTEIKQGDFLRIKFKMYDEECRYDGIYRVILDGWSGAALRLVELFEPEETYHTSLTWKRGDLTFDYVNHKDNPNYSKHLAVDRMQETVGIYDKIQILRHYSNDIEIVENYQPKSVKYEI